MSRLYKIGETAANRDSIKVYFIKYNFNNCI